MPKIITRTPSEVYQLWINALRSGKYKQTDGELKGLLNKGQPVFCCLGVVCDLAAKDGGEKWDGIHYKDENEKLPEQIRKFLKMTTTQHNKLIEMNDSQSKKFNEIADYIETKIMPKALKKSKVLS